MHWLVFKERGPRGLPKILRVREHTLVKTHVLQRCVLSSENEPLSVSLIHLKK